LLLPSVDDVKEPKGSADEASEQASRGKQNPGCLKNKSSKIKGQESIILEQLIGLVSNFL
jgi:hypothetical protein